MDLKNNINLNFIPSEEVTVAEHSANSFEFLKTGKKIASMSPIQLFISTAASIGLLTLSTDTYAQSVNEVSETATSVVQTFFTGAFNWAMAGIVIVLTVILAGFIKRVVGYRLARRQMHQEVLILTERAIHVGLIILGIIIAFRIVDIDLSTLFGFIGLGVGLALKDLLSNFIAGVMILTQKKFKLGDYVRVESEVGKIVEIDSRTTQIQTFDGTNLIIPNSKMLSASIENYTANTFRRISFTVGVHYNTPLAYCIKLIQASVKKHELIVPNPPIQVWVSEFADSSINLDIKFWIESTQPKFLVRSEVMQQLKIDFDTAGIEIPFPIRTLALEGQDPKMMAALHLPVNTYPKASS
jgi:small conductance mechanosensitive channel